MENIVEIVDAATMDTMIQDKQQEERNIQQHFFLTLFLVYIGVANASQGFRRSNFSQFRVTVFGVLFY